MDQNSYTHHELAPSYPESTKMYKSRKSVNCDLPLSSQYGIGRFFPFRKFSSNDLIIQETPKINELFKRWLCNLFLCCTKGQPAATQNDNKNRFPRPIHDLIKKKWSFYDEAFPLNQGQEKSVTMGH